MSLVCLTIRVVCTAFLSPYGVIMTIVFFFFFKQKTAYEMRISDWSSDVCSSDLIGRRDPPAVDLYERSARKEFPPHDLCRAGPDEGQLWRSSCDGWWLWPPHRRSVTGAGNMGETKPIDVLSYRLSREVSRLGTQCVMTFRCRVSPYI